VPNRKYQINASFEVIGGFWNSTTPDQIFTGTLTSRQGDFTLATAPTYSKISPESFIGEIGNTTSNVLSKVDGICGFTKEGDCSLLAAVLFDSDGLRDYSTLRAVQNLRYRASTAVMGLHVESPEAKTLDAAAFYFSKIHYLFPTPWGMQMINEGTVFTAPSRAVNVFTFRNAALEAEIICEVFAGGGTKVKKQTVIRRS
jgi:hypothetical protein